jgi:hypothetical protein
MFQVNKRYTASRNPMVATDKDRNDESQGRDSLGRSSSGNELT